YPEAVLWVDLRRLQAMQEQVHLAEEVGERLGLAADKASLLEGSAIRHRLALLGEGGVRLDEETCRAACRLEYDLAQPRVRYRNHEANHRSGRVELAVLACGVAHLAEHRFVQVTERKQFLLSEEVDVADLVDYIPQQIAREHPAGDVLE